MRGLLFGHDADQTVSTLNAVIARHLFRHINSLMLILKSLILTALSYYVPNRNLKLSFPWFDILQGLDIFPDSKRLFMITVYLPRLDGVDVSANKQL